MAFITPFATRCLHSGRTSRQQLTTVQRPRRWAARTRMTAVPQQQSIDVAWATFADKMKQTGEIPAIEEWHELLDVCEATCDKADKAIWIVNLMRETGLKPTAVTYEKVLRICSIMDDRAAAFHLVEHMFTDKVLLGDVELPDGMEEVLRKILPPEAFE